MTETRPADVAEQIERLDRNRVRLVRAFRELRGLIEKQYHISGTSQQVIAIWLECGSQMRSSENLKAESETLRHALAAAIQAYRALGLAYPAKFELEDDVPAALEGMPFKEERRLRRFDESGAADSGKAADELSPDERKSFPDPNRGARPTPPLLPEEEREFAAWKAKLGRMIDLHKMLDDARHVRVAVNARPHKLFSTRAAAARLEDTLEKLIESHADD